MRVAFFCSTPYQILNALAITTSEYSGDEVELYVLDYFKDAPAYVEKLKTLRLFVRVTLVRSWKLYVRMFRGYEEKTMIDKIVNKLTRQLWKMFYYSHYRQVLKNLGIDYSRMDVVFFSYLDPITIMLGLCVKRGWPKIEFYGFEDGLGSYMKGSEMIRYKLERLFPLPEQVSRKRKYYVYSPEFIENYTRYSDRISRIKYLPPLYQIVERVWGTVDAVNEKYIFFDGLEDEATLDSILHPFFSILGVDKIILKKHPRRFDKYYEKYHINIWAQQTMPWEVFLMSHNVAGKILISGHSTSCFSPKLIYNHEPFIIFLYRLMNSEADDGFSYMIRKLQQHYTDKTKVLIPETVKELEDILMRFKAMQA